MHVCGTSPWDSSLFFFVKLPGAGCLGILLAFTVTSVYKTQTTEVIAFKALFTIEFPVEKQYPRSIIDFPPSSIYTDIHS